MQTVVKVSVLFDEKKRFMVNKIQNLQNEFRIQDEKTNKGKNQ